MRSHGEGKGYQGFGRRAESTQLRFYEKDPRERIGASRGRSAKDYDASDLYGRDQRGSSGGSGGGSGDRHRSKSSDRRGKGRDIDEDVMRARRKVSGSRARRSETPPRRQDEGRSSGSPAVGAARSNPSPAGDASLTPTNGRGPVTEQPSGGTSDGSATRARESQNHPPPLAGNALSSAYDHVPMPTSSLEFHHSMGGDDLFSSLEDQESDPALRGVSPSVTSPLRRSSRSSSITSPTRGSFVASPAKTGVGGAGRAGAVATAPAASVASTFSSSEPAPTTTTTDTPETTRAAGALGSGIAPMDGSRTRWEEEQGNNGSEKAAESKGKTPSSPLPPPPPPPLGSPEEPPAPAAEGVGISAVSPPSSIQRQQDAAAACSPALGVPTADGGAERSEAADDPPAARGADKESAAQDSRVGGNVGAPCVEGATSSPTSRQVDLPAAGGDDGPFSQNEEAGPESESQYTTAERKGEAEEEEEEGEESASLDEEDEKEGAEVKENGAAGEENPPTVTKTVRRRGWHTEGTMVIINCSMTAKTGVFHPTVSPKDLRGRLVSGAAGWRLWGTHFLLSF